MTVKEAKEILKNYNTWRRGAKMHQPDPTIVGLAIDVLVDRNEFKRGWDAAMELNKSIQKAKPNMDKIDNVDNFINEIKGT